MKTRSKHSSRLAHNFVKALFADNEPGVGEFLTAFNTQYEADLNGNPSGMENRRSDMPRPPTDTRNLLLKDALSLSRSGMITKGNGG